jgi:pimeloyl-ACP methyl ester carboxylesterase
VTQVVKVPDGRRLSVESLGAPGGKPVFLFHGTPGGRNGPRPRGIVLYRLGIRLISYDRPGYSGSDQHSNRTVADAAGDVVAIADALGIGRFGVVGRSGGAPHALACAALLGERVTCAAALGSLAPYNAEGLDWCGGMADSNVRAYRDAEADLAALVAKLDEQAGQVRSDPESLLRFLWPELVDHDRKVIGDIALRRIIAETHAEALSETACGWIDDVIALRHPWGFELSTITAPVMLWHGSDDVFSPASHTHWLAKQIYGSELVVQSGAAHFGAVEILPRVLAWVAAQANMELRAEPVGAMSAPVASH